MDNILSLTACAEHRLVPIASTEKMPPGTIALAGKAISMKQKFIMLAT